MERKKFFTSRNIAFLAVLTALVVVLQLWGSYIRIGGTNLSFVLVPIVLGAVMVGPLAGAFLGLLFGSIVIAMGVTSDPFTIFLFSQNPANMPPLSSHPSRHRSAIQVFLSWDA